MNNSKIFIINNIDTLNSFLNMNSDLKFYSFENIDKNTENLLTKKKILNISNQKKIPKNNIKFLNDYISLISSIGRIMNSHYWWSSEMASKNPFTSNLSTLLRNYINVINIIKSLNDNKLIVYSKNKYLNYIIVKFLKKNNFLYDKKKFTYENRFIKIKNIYIYCIQFLSILYRLILAKIILTKKNNIYNNDVIIKSHIFEKQSVDINFTELFFGKLNIYLKNKFNITYVVHLHGNFYNNLIYLNKINKKDNISIFPYEYFLSFSDIIISFLKLSFYKFSIPKIYFMNEEISSLLNIEFSRSNISLNSWLIYNSSRKLIRLHKILKYLFLTYENRSWENMMLLGFQKFSPKTKIIGYQHSVVYPAAAGMFMKLDDKNIKPLPNSIITVGDVTKNLINQFSDYETGFIKSVCALRYDYLNSFNKIKRSKIKNIFIPLEGVNQVIDFVKLIFNFSKNHQNLNFIIRPHPIFNWTMISSFLDIDINNFSNCIVSKNLNLIDDLQNANICFYWSSAVSVEALKMGIPVIHYEMDTALSFDPLYNFNDFKWNVVDNESFKNVLTQIDNLSDVSYNKLQLKSDKFISEYFIETKDNLLQKFL